MLVRFPEAAEAATIPVLGRDITDVHATQGSVEICDITIARRFLSGLFILLEDVTRSKLFRNQPRRMLENVSVPRAVTEANIIVVAPMRTMYIAKVHFTSTRYLMCNPRTCAHHLS